MKRILSNWQFIIFVSFATTSIAFLSSVVLIKPKFESKSSLIIIQENASILAAARSVDYLSGIFKEVVFTDSFKKDILDSPFEIKAFNKDSKKDKAEWKKRVEIKTVERTGIINISVMGNSRKEAENILRGVNWNFIHNGEKYHGKSNDIIVKIIDGPITTKKPIYPNAPLNAFFGFVIGLIGSVILTYFLDDKICPVVNSKKNKRDKSRAFNENSLVKQQLQRQLARRETDGDLNYFNDNHSLRINNSKIKGVEELRPLQKAKKKSVGIKNDDSRDEVKVTDELSSCLSFEPVNRVQQLKLENNLKNKKNGRVIRFIKNGMSAINEVIGKENSKKKFDNNCISDSSSRTKERSSEVTTSARNKTAPPPSNLPIFTPSDDSGQQNQQELATSKDIAKSIKLQQSLKLKKSVWKDGSFIEVENNNSSKKKEVIENINNNEPTEQEIKDKLNKLLKGEM